MKKLKLDIQRFSSTNKTANYDLPQFVGTDKPTWLGDINQAMYDIDAGMHENATDIETMASDVASASAAASQASQDVAGLTSTVNTLSSNVTAVTTTANNAQQTATSALNTANTANGKADTNASAITTLTESVNTNTNDITTLKNKSNIDEVGRILSNQMSNTTIGGGSGKYYALTFSKEYPEEPIVLATVWSNNVGSYGAVATQVTNITTTGCTLLLLTNVSSNDLGIEYLVIE